MKILRQGHRYELENHEPVSLQASPDGSLAEETLKLCHEIEKLPASEQQTAVSIIASQLHRQSLYLNQQIQFIEKQKDQGGVFQTIYNGTTNEEVLRVLIDRLNHMNAKLPCRENSIAITHIETALLWLEKRTADRKARNVEGTPEK